MREFDKKKVFVQYRDKITPWEPVSGRKYTITHSDLTADLFVFIGEDYANDKISTLRDELRVSWEEGNRGLVLEGQVLIDGEGIEYDSAVRSNIFYNEIPSALKALRYADRFLFKQCSLLDNTPVIIHFISSKPEFNKTYCFGAIGEYCNYNY